MLFEMREAADSIQESQKRWPTFLSFVATSDYLGEQEAFDKPSEAAQLDMQTSQTISHIREACRLSAANVGHMQFQQVNIRHSLRHESMK